MSKSTEENKIKTFQPLNVSSKFAICGLPIRVDTYKNCSFGCSYCFANNRVIMEFDKHLQVGDINSVKRRLKKIFDDKKIDPTNFLDVLISRGYTWHCGGMSDPFQPCEEKYNITRDLTKVSSEYGRGILFSTKSNTVYNCWDYLDPDLHTFQLSVTNINDRKDLEPNVPSIESRVAFFDELKERGFRVGIRIQPFIPGVSNLGIVKLFPNADHFTLEGLKLVPQNKEHKEYLMKLFNLTSNDFTQMGLLNLKPEIRAKMYQPFIEYFEAHNMSYSIADNDFHQYGNNSCCCGDKLVLNSTNFNNTALCHTYGVDYTLEDVLRATNAVNVGCCKCNQLFTSNRQEGCVTVNDFFEKRFDRKSSPFSPKFLKNMDNYLEKENDNG